MSNEIKILSAEYKDLAEIRDFVVSLAIFEKEPEAVVCTLEEYQKSYLDKDICIYKACLNKKIIGMALYYYSFSTWKGRTLYLEDFIVDQNFRSSGIGKLLFKAVVNKAKEERCRQMKWQVLDWNEGAVNFYIREGANIDKSWWNGYLIFDQE